PELGLREEPEEPVTLLRSARRAGVAVAHPPGPDVGPEAQPLPPADRALDRSVPGTSLGRTQGSFQGGRIPREHPLSKDQNRTPESAWRRPPEESPNLLGAEHRVDRRGGRGGFLGPPPSAAAPMIPSAPFHCAALLASLRCSL